MVFALFQLVGGIILAFGWIPQIAQILKTKSVRDLNPKTFRLLFIGIGLMEVYAVRLATQGVGYAFLVSNSLSLLLMLFILVLIFRYRNTKEK